MDKIVLDASVVLEWLSEGKKSDAAITIHNDILHGAIAAWAPDFLLVEVANILLRKKKLSHTDVRKFIETLLAMGISFDDEPDHVTIHAIVDLAGKYHLTTYDAKYVYLAKKFQCKLVSFDQDLLRIPEWVTSPSSLSMHRSLRSNVT